MSELLKTDDYRQWVVSIKQRVQASQIKAAVAVNRELLELYWYIGEQIIKKQESAKWGEGFLEQLSKDLLDEFPKLRVFPIETLNPSASGIPSGLNLPQ